MRILICGDRNWTDKEMIRQAINDYGVDGNFGEGGGLGEGDTIIHGDARGADKLAGEVAQEFGCFVHAYPANWELYGRGAGPIRNIEMLDTSPEMVWAFHDNLEESKGTKHCVNEARRRGIPVRIFSHT